MKIRWTKLALGDLEAALEYLKAERPSAVPKLIDKIEKTLEIIRLQPEIGKAGRVEGTREFLITGTPFIIPYSLVGEYVEILAFIHGARRWPDKF